MRKKIIWFLIFFLFDQQMIQCDPINGQTIMQTKQSRAIGDDIEWWQHATIYQIYPRSFMDSTGDGIGDLQGIISKLDHLQTIGVDAIWLSPIFKSALIDFGYDVIDFEVIHEEYGDLDDFAEFVEQAKQRGIRVLLDFVPNHTSDQCKWFIDSAARVEGYEEYYVWHNGTVDEFGNRQPPNNWISVFGGPAWTFNEVRDQWYLHQFYKEQPDLNYRNEKVIEEMLNILKFWFDKGVAGFRVDAFNHLFEHPDFPDEERNWGVTDENDYEYLLHTHTKDRYETYEMLYSWRRTLDEWQAVANSETKILMTEAYASIENTMRYYQYNASTQGAHMPFNFELIYISESKPNAKRFKSAVDQWLDHMPVGKTAVWVTGSHDHRRVATRIGSNYVGIMNTVNLLLPGSSITYYGEEIGMSDNLDFEVSDSRDPNRTPMQWDAVLGAGFSTIANTWLPINQNYQQINVNAQRQAERSTYKHFIELTSVRKTQTIIAGDIFMKVLSQYVFSFIRELPGHPTYAVVVNLDETDIIVDLSVYLNLPGQLKVAASSELSDHRIGDNIQTNNVALKRYDAVVFVSGSAAFVKLSISALIISFIILIMQ